MENTTLKISTVSYSNIANVPFAIFGNISFAIDIFLMSTDCPGLDNEIGWTDVSGLQLWQDLSSCKAVIRLFVDDQWLKEGLNVRNQDSSGWYMFLESSWLGFDVMRSIAAMMIPIWLPWWQLIWASWSCRYMSRILHACSVYLIFSQLVYRRDATIRRSKLSSLAVGIMVIRYSAHALDAENDSSCSGDVIRLVVCFWKVHVSLLRKGSPSCPGIKFQRSSMLHYWIVWTI